MENKENKNSFENTLSQLEALVQKLESGDGTLENSLEWFEEGMTLIKLCRRELSSAEQKVSDLIQNSDDSPKSQKKK
jgi:exodeoxyribonuclease VII small subunit